MPAASHRHPGPIGKQTRPALASPSADAITRSTETVLSPIAVAVAFIASAVLTAMAIQAMLPLLQRYALVRPNARSSHRVPTPQGGGGAVVAVGLGVAAAVLATSPGPHAWPQLLALIAGALVLAGLGAWDDLAPLRATPRLLVQLVVAGGVAATLPVASTLAPLAPPLAWAVVVVAIVWFVNLVNFMDGLNWLTVAEVLPVTLSLVVLGLLGVLEPAGTVVAAALAGGLVGFAPFNRPVARLFLGDVGSLPIGLLVAWLLFGLVAAGHAAAACLLPLYYLADATLTLLRRILRGERFWQAHRTHFYQQATTNGFTALAVTGRVAGLNVALAALAGVSVAAADRAVDVAAVSVGAALVAWQLRGFARPRPTTPP